MARWLNEIGVSACVVDYRVAPYRHPVPLADAQRAVRWVRYHAADLGIRADRVAVMGFSAGGHLAATLAAHHNLQTYKPQDEIDKLPCHPDALILCYPVITFGEYRHEGSLRNLLGDAPDESLRELLSIERQVTARMPPAFIWHTADDAGVPVENSLLFAQALSRAKVPFELHIYPHGRHGLGLAEEDAAVGAWRAACARWLFQLDFGGKTVPSPS
ncbi:hypothetical protein GCM10010885_07210 [Alicyclobacillus cellulosilyticus]|uniref:BD-FAE-like domain-containing protein n=1 Tax=Alicyclobacillus cellulosilyticus TaxID=1003997 RepID=A0A917K6A7_9BACL|nr:hypothetical protein GCM10010885_07210 [Alicyclobacillus cellulosilyticus]